MSPAVKPAPELVSEHGKGQSGPGGSSYKPPKPKPKPKPKPVAAGVRRRQELVSFSHTLLGIHEVPDGSNDGPGVRTIQSSTGQYRAPWCVSTLQYEDRQVIGSTYADRTAGAYDYADYAARHGDVIGKPVAGCAVIYHIGLGHAGRVVSVLADGTFYAIEGNEENAVRLVHRDPRAIRCTFVLRPELRG